MSVTEDPLRPGMFVEQKSRKIYTIEFKSVSDIPLLDLASTIENKYGVNDTTITMLAVRTEDESSNS